MTAVNLNEAVDQAVTDFDEIKEEIEAQGVEVGDVPTSVYDDKINAIPVFLAPRSVIDGVASETMHADNLVTIGEDINKSIQKVDTMDFGFTSSWGGFRSNTEFKKNEYFIGYNPYADKNAEGNKRLIFLICDGSPTDINNYTVTNDKYSIQEIYASNPSNLYMVDSIEGDKYASGKIYSYNGIWKLDETDNVFKKINRYWYGTTPVLSAIKNALNDDYNLNLNLDNTTVTTVTTTTVTRNKYFSTVEDLFYYDYVCLVCCKIVTTVEDESGNNVTKTYYTYYVYKYTYTAQTVSNISGISNFELLWHMPTLAETTSDSYAKFEYALVSPDNNKILLCQDTNNAIWLKAGIINYLNILDITDLNNINLTLIPRTYSYGLQPFWLNNNTFTYRWVRAVNNGINTLQCCKLSESQEVERSFNLTLNMLYNETSSNTLAEGTYVYTWKRIGKHLVYTHPTCLFIINTETLEGYIIKLNNSIYPSTNTYGYLTIIHFIDDYNFLIFADNYPSSTNSTFQIKKNAFKTAKSISLVKDLRQCKDVGTVNENALAGDSVTVRVWTDINEEE